MSGHFGTRQSRTQVAIESPSTVDLAWAAGVYEGEGSCRHTTHTPGATVTQKDHWMLDRFQSLFGGSVYDRSHEPHTGHPHTTHASTWQVTGARARGFLMTMYPFLSPRKKNEVRLVLSGVHPARRRVT